MLALEAYEHGELNIPEDKLQKFLNSPEAYTVKNIDTIVKPSKDHDEVKKWGALAQNWLELLWKKRNSDNRSGCGILNRCTGNEK